MTTLTQRIKGYALLATAVVTCPCHIPIIAAIFAGSALGSVISAHYLLSFIILGLYFSGAIFYGMRLLARNEGKYTKVGARDH